MKVQEGNPHLYVCVASFALTQSANVELHGSVYDSLAATAAACGSLAVLKFAVRHAYAEVHSNRNDVTKDVITAGRQCNEIIQWILVQRFQEQPNICYEETSMSKTGPTFNPWTGVATVWFLLDRSDWRREGESTLDFLVWLNQLRRKLRGTAVSL